MVTINRHVDKDDEVGIKAKFWAAAALKLHRTPPPGWYHNSLSATKETEGE